MKITVEIESEIEFTAKTIQDKLNFLLSTGVKVTEQSRMNTVNVCVPYQACPVCGGYGQVRPMYNREATTAVHVPCDVCNGSKIIPMAHIH